MALPPAHAADPVLVGAGDIADCSSSADAATAALVRSIAGRVFTLGDNAYRSGTYKQFTNCYGPTWGKVKSRTRPAVRNHEYQTTGADRYWHYFGDAAGLRRNAWYTYTAGDWRVIVLNSNCGKVGCGKGSDQERWLRAELARSDAKCTLAYFQPAAGATTGSARSGPTARCGTPAPSAFSS